MHISKVRVMSLNNREKATGHRQQLVELIVSHVRGNPGQTNAEIAVALGLESSFEGGQRNYLSFSLLCDAVADGRLIREKTGRNIRYSVS